MSRHARPPAALKAAVDAFSSACRSKGLSVTHQRLAVYEAVASSRSHPGAEEIYQAVRARLPTISRGTVYRTLETLRGMGLVNEVRAGEAARYEAADEPHHHLVCLSCRRIVDVHDASLGGLALPPGAGAMGFEVTGYQIQFTGFCRGCSPRSGPEGPARRPRRPGGAPAGTIR